MRKVKLSGRVNKKQRLLAYKVLRRCWLDSYKLGLSAAEEKTLGRLFGLAAVAAGKLGPDEDEE